MLSKSKDPMIKEEKIRKAVKIKTGRLLET